MKKLILSLILVLTVGIMITGCGQNTAVTDNTGNQANNDSNDITIEQYFANPEYVAAGGGDEKTELMPPVKYKLSSDVENKYIEAVYSLKDTGDASDEMCTMMKEDFVINSISVDDGVAYVDFSAENLRAEALEEVILVDQIVYTLSNSFDDVAAVKLSVDGRSAGAFINSVNISKALVADYL